jgi:hypothetical protein
MRCGQPTLAGFCLRCGLPEVPDVIGVRRKGLRSARAGHSGINRTERAPEVDSIRKSLK